MHRTFLFCLLILFIFSCVRNNGKFTDHRDNKEYTWVKIGGQIWMTENLAYLPKVHTIEDHSLTEPRYYIYGNTYKRVEDAKKYQVSSTESDSMIAYEKFGVLYNWEAVADGQIPDKKGRLQGACPVGWHVPSDKEWMQLEHSLGMDEIDLPAIGLRSSGTIAHLVKSGSMWDREGNGVDAVGFNAKPAGQAYSGMEYLDLHEKAVFWSATKDVNGDIWTREVNCCDNGVIRRSGYKEDGFAVRCVKD